MRSKEWSKKFYEGSEDPSEYWREMLDDIKALEAINARLAEALEEYGVHMAHCLLSQRRAGRPTKDGGYESKYGDKWYQGDDKPACTCGLSDIMEEVSHE